MGFADAQPCWLLFGGVIVAQPAINQAGTASR